MRVNLAEEQRGHVGGERVRSGRDGDPMRFPAITGESEKGRRGANPGGL
jgi:hypothetical protein